MTKTDSEDELRDGEEPEDEPIGPAWIRKRRRRLLVRRVGGHVEHRLSFAALTLSTFGFSAGALLIVIAVVGAVAYVVDGRFLHALAFLLIGLGLAAVSAASGFGAGFVGLPFAGDWFLEWSSHAIGWSIGIAGCALLAILIFLTPLPAYGGVLLAIATVFAAGYCVAYTLPTTSPLPSRQGRQRR